MIKLLRKTMFLYHSLIKNITNMMCSFLKIIMCLSFIVWNATAVHAQTSTERQHYNALWDFIYSPEYMLANLGNTEADRKFTAEFQKIVSFIRGVITCEEYKIQDTDNMLRSDCKRLGFDKKGFSRFLKHFDYETILDESSQLNFKRNDNHIVNTYDIEKRMFKSQSKTPIEFEFLSFGGSVNPDAIKKKNKVKIGEQKKIFVEEYILKTQYADTFKNVLAGLRRTDKEYYLLPLVTSSGDFYAKNIRLSSIKENNGQENSNKDELSIAELSIFTSDIKADETLDEKFTLNVKDASFMNYRTGKNVTLNVDYELAIENLKKSLLRIANFDTVSSRVKHYQDVARIQPRIKSHLAVVFNDFEFDLKVNVNIDSNLDFLGEVRVEMKNLESIVDISDPKTLGPIAGILALANKEDGKIKLTFIIEDKKIKIGLLTLKKFDMDYKKFIEDLVKENKKS